MRVLKVECSRLRLLENSNVTTLLFVYCVHIACYYVLAYLSISFSIILFHNVVGLLVNKYVVVIGIDFVYRFNVKQWHTISIFVTIL